MATLFHKFYNACRVKGEDEALMQARLSLCLAVRTTLKNVLALLKISAPGIHVIYSDDKGHFARKRSQFYG